MTESGRKTCDSPNITWKRNIFLPFTFCSTTITQFLFTCAVEKNLRLFLFIKYILST